jgi:hypothetical protein
MSEQRGRNPAPPTANMENLRGTPGGHSRLVPVMTCPPETELRERARGAR